MLDIVLRVETLDQGKPHKLSINAERVDCTTLAERFGWVDVCSLTAELKAKSIADRAYDIRGRIEGAIIQRCRVTGNPVPESIAIDVHERFASLADDDGEAEIDPMAVSVEVIENGVIPVGEMIAQLVGLEASAWPRDPEAEGFVTADRLDDPTPPFASLAEWKKKL